MALRIFSNAFVILLLFGTSYAQEVCSATGCTYSNVASVMAQNSAQPSLHYYIGGLFGVHERASNAYSCGDSPIRERGLINLEAFLWAVQEYGPMISSTVSVGAIGMDTCSFPDQTIENILSFETCKVQFVGNPSPRNLLAYIGPDTSTDTKSSAMLLKEMNKTQVTPAATSPELSKKDPNFPFLLRTVPSDVYDAIVMSTFISSSLQVRYVIAVYINNDYGRAGYEALQREAGNKNICIVYAAMMEENPTGDELAAIADAIYTRQVTRYVVVYADAASSRTLLEAIDTRRPGQLGNVIFIGPSSWTMNVVDGLDVTAYSTSLSVPSAFDSDVNKFYTHFNNLKPTSNTKNPWFQAYWNMKCPNCNVTTSTLENRYTRDPYVPFVLAAVKAVIQGVQDGAVAACSTTDLCSNYLNNANRGQQIYDGIVNAKNTFAGVSTNFFAPLSGEYRGDADNSYTNYDLYILTGDANQATTAVKIGSYTPSTGLTMSTVVTLIPSTCPNSPCTECGENPTSAPTTAAPSTSTAATTTTDPMAGAEYISLRFLRTEQMTGIFGRSSEPRTLYDTRFEIGQRWIIALGVLAGIGLLAVVVFEVYILYKLLGTHIGRQWRTMWLGQLLLFGIFLSYLTLFAYLFIPTDATCGITRFGVGVCYAIMFAVLLVKLMVILTSKSSSESLIAGDIESPNYLKGIYQFLMFIFAVGVQVVINVQWLIQVPPYAVKVMANNGENVWICNHFTWEAQLMWNDMQNFVRTPFENHLLSLLYIMFLILMTTIVAMKAHGIITNHRESVFIGIAAGFSIPVWIAWGLVGGLNRNHAYAQEFGDACIAFGLFVTATLCLFSMFLPKVRQLVNMGVEGIYLEDDRDTYYAGSVIMAPPSYKSRPSSMVYVNAQEYTNPVVLGNGDPNHLKHPGSMYSGHSAPVYTKRSEIGSSKVLRVTGDLTGKYPAERKKPTSEIGYPTYAGTYRRTRSEAGGTLRKSSSSQHLGAL